MGKSKGKGPVTGVCWPCGGPIFETDGLHARKSSGGAVKALRMCNLTENMNAPIETSSEVEATNIASARASLLAITGERSSAQQAMTSDRCTGDRFAALMRDTTDE